MSSETETQKRAPADQEDAPVFLQVELCSPGRQSIHIEAKKVILPGKQGIFTVLPGHTPFLSTLDIGVAIITDKDGKDSFFSIIGGFAEILQDKVLILAQTSESADAIDEKRAEDARPRSAERLQTRSADIDERRAERALRRAMARLQAHRRQGY